MATTISPIELNDIQGLIAYSHSHLPEAVYVMIHFTDKEKATGFLGQVLPKITSAAHKPIDHAWQIAFTNHGMFQWFPEKQLTQCFSREFTEGMTDGVRQRILGDMEQNGPTNWEWGNETAGYIHAVIMLYAADAAALQQERETLNTLCDAYAVTVIRSLLTAAFGPFEHFGFNDGITNPEIVGIGKRKQGPHSNDKVMPGEFILGYPNEYDKYPFSPQMNGLDIGRNGSYMVFRQLEQDVKGFWKFVKEATAADPFFKGDYDLLAAKMVGRHRDGTPLTPHRPATPEDKNGFLYSHEDKDGQHCPVGAHIRKTNPRDGIDHDPAASLDIVSKHRILRRGRSYGAPLSPDYDPEKMLTSDVTGGRGLFFICFNTQIKRQFEFIQSAWSNSNKFDGLYDDLDPLIGFPIHLRKYCEGSFTITACPFRKKVHGIPQFVFTKGGAYFFMPGLNTLRQMAG